MQILDTDDRKKILLETVRKFVDPNEQEWFAFHSLFKPKFVGKNHVYLRAGETGRHLGFVCRGCFRMYYFIKGEERCKDFQVEGQFTGSLYSFLSNKPALFNVAAVEDSELLEIHRDALFTLYDQFPIWEKFGRMYMEEIFLYKEKREATLLFLTAKQRYEEFISTQKDLAQRLPLKYISSYLGIKPESLSRLRKEK